ncbi:Uncharacterized protein QTN25_004719 [Entamoeba marina]
MEEINGFNYKREIVIKEIHNFGILNVNHFANENLYNSTSNLHTFPLLRTGSPMYQASLGLHSSLNSQMEPIERVNENTVHQDSNLYELSSITRCTNEISQLETSQLSTIEKERSQIEPQISSISMSKPLTYCLSQMILLPQHLQTLSSLLEKQRHRVLFDGISLYEGIPSLGHCLINGNKSVIFETVDGNVFGVHHHESVENNWNDDRYTTVFSLTNQYNTQPTLFRSYGKISSRLSGCHYDVLGFCYFNLQTSLLFISAKFNVYFIDFLRKNGRLFGAIEPAIIKVKSFSIVEWL